MGDRASDCGITSTQSNAHSPRSNPTLSSSPSLSSQPLPKETALSLPIISFQEDLTAPSEEGLPNVTQESAVLCPTKMTPPSSLSPVELGIAWNKSEAAFSRSDMLPMHHPLKRYQTRAPPPIRSAVSDGTSPPTVLTTELLDIGDDARTTYMAVCEEHGRFPRDTASFSFSSLSPEQLETHFAAAVDAKNALRLRKSVVAIDISDSLEALLPKLTMYEDDGRVLANAFADMDSIRDECTRRGLSPNFNALESFRERFPSHTQSIMETHRDLFCSMQYVVEERSDAQQTAAQFLEDPFALKEHRLRHLTCQR